MAKTRLGLHGSAAAYAGFVAKAAFVAIAFDAVSVATPGTGTMTWTHTPVGTPAAVEVWTHNAGGTKEFSGVTYGGVAMVEQALSPLIKTNVEAEVVCCWALFAGIPTGAQSVVATSTGGNSKGAHAITLTAGTTVEAVNTVAISNDAVVDPTATLGLLGRTCFVAIGFTSGQGAVTGIAPNAGWTERSEFDFGAQVGAIYTYDTIGATDVTVGWTQGNDDAIGLALAVAEVVGGGAFTLTADSGSLALTGTAADLKAGRTVAAAAGSYVLTGTAADLTATRHLTAAGGVYALTGTDAVPRVARLLTAAEGVYTWTGAASTLSRTHMLTADAGAYAWTGTVADLTWSGADVTVSGISLSGSYQPSVSLTGSFVPSISLTGSVE